MVDISNPRYTYTKRGIFYYSRCIPCDLKGHYSKSRFVKSLRTKSATRAAIASRSITAKLDDYWLGLRLKQIEVPASHLLNNQVSSNFNSLLPRITEAQELYFKTKGHGRGKLFFTHTKRAISYVVGCLGDRALDQYTGADAAKLREWLKVKGLQASSIQRNFSCVKAVLNLTINELGLQCANAFNGVYLESISKKSNRVPFSTEQLRKLQQACIDHDDDIRHLLALISDTGMRLGEATGLLLDDLVMDGDYPHVVIRPHPHRSLKTANSERVVPLVGSSLWAAKRILATATTNHCFSRYSNNNGCNANSASAAINKWLKATISKDVVIHALRHSFRDRLRALEAPVELIDQLGGWSLKSVGQSYGDGYRLEQLTKVMQKMPVSTLAIV